MPSILFVCRHNACRSQIAEAIGRELAPKSWVIDSAGSHPTAQVDPKAAAILKEFGLEMWRNRPQAFSQLVLKEWDYVVDISCEKSGINVPAKNYLKWDIPDPLDGPMPFYSRLFDSLSERINDLFRAIQRQLAAKSA
ncbi:MAG: low molecular weight phosphatase family protein [Elusimicrobia bacterium]|nr:low molecular weight phosphatase family protein [Elusimicrobiota bacterium]